MAPHVRLRSLLQRLTRHRQRQDSRRLQGGRGAARLGVASEAERMSRPFRVAGGPLGGSRRLSFTFDGATYLGLAGDTLASALLADGVHLVGRSYKYHRPRGILTAGAEEPNALVGVSRGPGRFTPNLRATQIELTAALVPTTPNPCPP